MSRESETEFSPISTADPHQGGSFSFLSLGKKFERAPLKWKIPILALATMAMLWKMSVFLRVVIFPVLADIISKPGEVDRVWTLIFFDVFVVIVGSVFVVSIIQMLSGDPGSMQKLFFVPFLRGRPFWTFLLFTSSIAAILVMGPKVLPNLMMHFHPYNAYGLSTRFPNDDYIRSALLAALGIGLSMADISVKSRLIHWWLLPFTAVPWKGFYLFPILWWNAAANWLPSRYWSIWRPVLVLSTCLMPVLIYPLHPVIISGIPLYSPKALESQAVLGNSACYQVEPAPGGQAIFMRCRDGDLNLYVRDQGTWKRTINLQMPFEWDRGAFDFEKETGYFYDGRGNRIFTVDLRNVSIRSEYKIPPGQFDWKRGNEDRKYNIFVLLDKTGENLFIAKGDGEIGKFRAAGFELTALAWLDRSYIGDIMGMEYNEKTDKLIALQPRKLTEMRGGDLSVSRTLRLESAAYGLLLDRQRNRIVLSFPGSLKAVAYDLDDFKPVETWPAPAGVRVVGFDESKGLIFLASISGVLEVRTMRDGKLINRVRLVPWIHWIQVFPEYGEVIATAGDVPPMHWRYDPPDARIDLMDDLLRLAETMMRFASEHYAEFSRCTERVKRLRSPST